MKSLVRPELPTASVGSSQATIDAVDNSAPSVNRPEQSTYKSGKAVQTNRATSTHMPQIFITTTAVNTRNYPWALSNYLRVMKAAELSTDRRYQLSRYPSSADILLFVEPRFEFQSDILASPLYRVHSGKSVVLDFLDNPKPVLPGLYVGITQAQTCGGIFQGNAYIRIAANRLLEDNLNFPYEPDLLFSFIGNVANAYRIRSSVLRLQHPRARVIDRNSHQSESDIDYVQTLLRSKFVLCPRGIGPSSWRLFETMRVGRVPVVISDEWVPPPGIDWHSFVVRVLESEVHEIPALLLSLEPEWAERGRRARQIWESNLSYQRLFGWIGERCTEVLEISRKEGYRASMSRQFARTDSFCSAARLMRELFK